MDIHEEKELKIYNNRIIVVYLHKILGTMEELIKQKCESVGLSPDILTPEEIEKLKEEIKAEQRGKMILGGVLDNQELYFRKAHQ